MKDSSQELKSGLVELGFASLEAEVYGLLLTEPAVTGYRVAQALRKPAPNTYKALESLERKGAVVVGDGVHRKYRAVPANEVLAQLTRRFDDACKRTNEAVSQLEASPWDDRIYQLRTRGQVLERCRSMLAGAESVAVMDLSPGIFGELRGELEATASRGVEMTIKAYEPTECAGARVVVRPRGHEVLDAIPGDLVNLNTDGTEHVLGLLEQSGDGVLQAIWTSGPIVSYLLYNGLVNEISQVAFMAELEGDTTVERLRETFASLRHLHPISSNGIAYRNLMKRFSAPITSQQKDGTE